MDPDPPISEPEMGGGSSLKNIFFQPFGPQFGPKFKGGLGPQAPPLNPSLWVAPSGVWFSCKAVTIHRAID